MRKEAYQGVLSKYKIDYHFVDGIDSITYERFLEENPKATLQDFREWLAVIELMTLEERRANWRQTHKNCRLIGETKHAPSAPSAEEIYITSIEEEEAEQGRLMKLSLVNQALKSMSSKQRRRYLLHVACGLTVRQVGQLEGVAPSVAHRSIKRAESIIRRYISEINS